MKWTYLRTSTKNVSPTSIIESTRSRHVFDLELNYDPQNKIMMFTGKVTGSQGYYDWIISFLDVERDLNLTPNDIKQGRYPKPSLSRNEIQVFCSCPSFRFTFSNADQQRGVKTGPDFPDFQNKSHRLSRNPKQKPGMCKHIIYVVNYLKHQGFIK